MIKLFDIRNLKQEMQIFRGHRSEVSCIAWHPIHEGLFSSGGGNGDMYYWHVGEENELASVEPAHNNIIWTLDWHPMGHVLVSGSNDNTARFWVRNRPGEKMDHTGCNKDHEEHEQAPDLSYHWQTQSLVQQTLQNEKLKDIMSSQKSEIPGLNRLDFCKKN